jgi:hypothetical protein
MKRLTIVDLIVSALILLFVYASVSKLANIQGFQTAMRKQPFPHWLSSILVWAVPALELAIASLLMTTRTKLLGLYSSLGLMSLFTLYIIAILLHSFSRIPCSCGGVIQSLGWTQHLFFNLFFVVITGYAIIIEKRTKYFTREIRATGT